MHDGQSGFTLFTTLFRSLAETIGLSRASMLISAAAVAAAFFGAVVLASAFATGPARWLIIAFAAALPAQYGGYKLFSYAEVAATPRPFAEALVLCGIAALLHRRHVAAIFLMAFAALLHPIMAASGFAGQRTRGRRPYRSRTRRSSSRSGWPIAHPLTRLHHQNLGSNN